MLEEERRACLKLLLWVALLEALERLADGLHRADKRALVSWPDDLDSAPHYQRDERLARGRHCSKGSGSALVSTVRWAGAASKDDQKGVRLASRVYFSSVVQASL